MTSPPRPDLARNRLLCLLPETELRELEPDLKFTSHQLGDVLYDARALIEHVYFPLTCVTSMLTLMEDGAAIEVATVGREGLVGYAVGVRMPTSVNRVVVQVPGDSLRMNTNVFLKALGHSDAMSDLLSRYHRAYSFQVSRSVACNGLHQLEKRCCRWLLMTRDRIDSNEIPLTHEYLGYMLGVRRASVSDILSALQAAGMITYHRGMITLVDPRAVEARSCECYGSVRDEYDALLALPS